MTQIKFGQLISDARGSTAGMTFTKNKSGSVMRTKKNACQPDSDKQGTVKKLFAEASFLWSTLTVIQKSYWNMKAAQYPHRNMIGDTSPLSGFNFFVQSMTMQLRHGLTPVLDRAPIVNPSIWKDYTFTRDPATNALAFTSNTKPAQDVYMNIFLEPLRPKNKPFRRSALRLVHSFVIDSAKTTNITPYYEATFGTLSALDPPADFLLLAQHSWFWYIVSGGDPWAFTQDDGT